MEVSYFEPMIGLFMYAARHRTVHTHAYHTNGQATELVTKQSSL